MACLQVHRKVTVSAIQRRSELKFGRTLTSAVVCSLASPKFIYFGGQLYLMMFLGMKVFSAWRSSAYLSLNHESVIVIIDGVICGLTAMATIVELSVTSSLCYPKMATFMLRSVLNLNLPESIKMETHEYYKYMKNFNQTISVITLTFLGVFIVKTEYKIKR